MNNELITLLAGKFGLAFDYVEQNFAEICDRYVQYKLTYHTIILSIVSILFVCAVIWDIICYNSVKKKKPFFVDKYNEMTELAFFITFLMICVAIVCIIPIIIEIKNLIGWNLCPEMMLLEVLNK